MKTNLFFSHIWLKRYKTSSLAQKPVRKPFRAKKQQNFKEFGEGFVINRFPIMCVYAYCLARKCGYSEKLSKSLGYAVATYYAVLKNVGLGRYGKARTERKPTFDDYLIDEGKLKEVEYLNFAGGTFAIKNDEVLGIATIRGKQNGYEPEKFDWQVQKLEAVKKGYFERLCQKWQEIIENEDLEQLKNGRLFFRIWKQWRDEFRKAEFLK